MELLFFIHLFIYSFIHSFILFPSRRRGEMKTKNEVKTWDRLGNICLSWPILFDQDGWMSTFFFFSVFMNLYFVAVHNNVTKDFGQYPAILTSRLVNNAHEYTSCRPIQTWQGKANKNCTSEPGICLSLVDKVWTSVLITQVYHQNLLR